MSSLNSNTIQMTQIINCISCNKRNDCLYYINNRKRFEDLLQTRQLDDVIRVDKLDANGYRVWYRDHEYTDVFVN